MCLAYPGIVEKINGRSALVRYPSGSKKVMFNDNSLKVGCWVLVQMGVVVKTLSSQEAKEILSAWAEIKPN